MQWAQRKYVNLDGVNVHYVEAGAGPTVLLLHGLGTSLITWRQNVGPLAAAGFHVLAPDLPGHGDSDKPRHLSYDPLSGAHLLHRFLQSQGVAHAHAVQEALPHSQVRILSHCGHWPQLEKPELFNPLLVQFLQGTLHHSPRTGGR